MQRTSLRLLVVASLALAACGDDKGDDTGELTTTTQATPATDMTASSGDPGTDSTSTGSTSDTPTTGDPTTEPVATTTTGDDPTSTTADDTTSTTADESSTGPDTTTGVVGLSFAADVFPVWNPPVRCDCHVGGAGGMKLGATAGEAYAAMVGVSANGAPLNRVEPGDHLTSYVFHKISGTQADVGGGGSNMPLGAPLFSQTDIDLIAQWIDEGASP
jgi:hypothetical protein